MIAKSDSDGAWTYLPGAGKRFEETATTASQVATHP